MKKTIILSTLAAVLVFTAGAQQDSSGIYKTATDFASKTLSYAINCKKEKHKINPNLLFNSTQIKVKHGGSIYMLSKSETFGYKACDGTAYRFVNNSEYKILNPVEGLLLYEYQHPAHSPKNAEQYPVMHFFSSGADGPVQPLTLANVKAAFPDSHKFHDALDAQIKQDKDLVAYDAFHKMYKLNWLMANAK